MCSKQNSLLFTLLVAALLPCLSFALEDVDLFLEPEQANASLTNVRGLIKPVEKAVISSQIAAQIDRIPRKSAQKFRKGDILVSFDCAFYRADLMAAEANLKAKNNVFENNKQLLALNAMSDIDVSISVAVMVVDRAYSIMRAIKVSQCEIKATYYGRVIDVAVNEHETIPADTEILSILNDRDLDIERIVSSTWLTWLKVGESFSFNIDETNETVKAEVKKIGAVIDPVSQTVRVTGKFVAQPKNVLSGMSGTARFTN